ncbi:MAG: hypothetical protein JSV49_00920 [Thermoplasmata archaeon]|nr:MAG: hypothetical protein JSV49_00920 [Thermoplasmata archaeon]
MWTIGHCALAYIISRPFLGKRPIEPLTLLSIFFFASILDFAHVYEYRTFTHSLIFFIPFVAILLWILITGKILRREHIIPISIAASTHIIADVLFGSFAFFVPLSFYELNYYGWGSYLDYSIEIVLFSIMMVTLHFTGDLKQLQKLTIVGYDDNKAQRIFHNVVLIGLILAILGQLGGVVYLDFLNGYNFYNQKIYNDGSMWYMSLAFIIIHIIFIVILVPWAFRRLEKRVEELDI